MASTVIDLILRGRDDGASAALGAVSNQVGGLGGTLQQAVGFAAGNLLSAGIDAVTNSIGGLYEGMVGGNAQFEQYGVQFEVLLGSAEAAEQRMAELAQFGATTPFELPGVVEADRILQAFGLHSQEAAEDFGYSGEQIRTLAGDVASGTGAEFQEVALLLGKFSQGATGESLARMAELGIVSKAQLADLGLEFDKSGSLLSPLPEAMSVVLGVMEDKYGGMMSAQSTTFSGMMSNLEDWKSGTLRTIGEPIFDVLKENLGSLLAFLGSAEVQAGIQAFAQGLAQGIGTAIQWLTTTGLPAIQSFASYISENFDTIAPIVAGVAAAFTAFTVINTVIGAVTGAVAAFTAVGAAISAAGGVATFVVALLGGPLTLAVGAVAVGIGLLTVAWTQNWGGIQQITGAAVAVVSQWISTTLANIQLWWAQHGDQVILTVTNFMTGVQTFIGTAITTAQTVVTTILTSLQTFWQEHGNSIMTIVTAAFEFIQTTITTIITTAQLVIETALTGIQLFWQAHGDSIIAFTNTAWEGIQTAISTVLGVIGSVIDAFALAVEGDWYGFGENLRIAADTAWAAITGLIESAGVGLSAIVSGITSSLVNIWNTTDWAGVGSAVVSGISGGISAGAGAIADAARSAAQAALDAAKGLLGINSPSSVFWDEVGYRIPEGTAGGINEGSVLAEAASRSFVERILPRPEELINAGKNFGEAFNGIVPNIDGKYVSLPGVGLIPVNPLDNVATVPGGFRPDGNIRFGSGGGSIVPPATHGMVSHTYNVTINDERAMNLFLDYLDTIRQS